MFFDKRILNLIIIISLTFVTFLWTFYIFHIQLNINLIISVIVLRIIASVVMLQDYSLSWSRVTQTTFLIKSIVNIVPFSFYTFYYYGEFTFSLLASELFLYLFAINFLMYGYYFYVNRSNINKTKNLVIYGAGKAGTKLESEFKHSEYKVRYFCDDDITLQNRSINGTKILSKERLKDKLKSKKYDLLVVAMPSVVKNNVQETYSDLHNYFKEIQILPSLDQILKNKNFKTQLKDISVEDLLARRPRDLDQEKISSFIKDKIILITGAGGSIGSEISRQCQKFGAKELILLDHSEYNLYNIAEELKDIKIKLVMQSVVNLSFIEETFKKYKPEIVIHAAAYKHVPLVEENVNEAIINNVLGTKNVIDSSIKYGIQKVVLISTDKAVRPTNVMGTTKRICELYAQNVKSNNTEIVSVRFGNVLGSSGSVIPKFKSQIENGENITVTHPDITRYFMLIPEACELVLQAGSLGKGGEIFILDMGEPIKIVDLAQKMIDLSQRNDISIEFTGLRAGEKLYEELLLDESDTSTQYESITIAGKTDYPIEKLNFDIKELIEMKNKIKKLKDIVPEFDHNKNC